MKTLNLNKLTILLGLFLVSAFFTTSANASCVESSTGVIAVNYNANSDRTSGKPVSDTVAIGDVAALANNFDCLVTPAEYKLVFYKYGICKEDPDLNDLTSCAFLFEDADGIEHDIELGVSESLAIPEFAIEPGIYPYSYVLLSNELGMKWSGTMQLATTGENTSGNTGTDGVNCWTSGRGPTSATYQTSGGGAVTTVHGTTTADDTVTIECNPTMGTPAFNYEILTRFSSEDLDGNDIYCNANLLANGDKSVMDIEGTGQGRGIPTVSLLTTADIFATTCQNSAKIAWTTDLDTPLTITENSTYEMLMLATDSNTMLWDNGANNDIYKIESGAPKIMLKVTD